MRKRDKRITKGVSAMLSEKDKREAWKIYSQKRKGNKPFRGISHEDSKARRVAY
ncbi:MAG: hypothetical protein RLZZ396_4, partial [Planctomycetota bacterium]